MHVTELSNMLFVFVNFVCLTQNHLCPQYHPLSLHFTFFIPLSPQLPAHQLCSDGWEKQTGGVVKKHARTQPPMQMCMPTHIQSDLLQEGSKTFVPEFEDFSLFSFFTICDHINIKQMPLHKWLQTNMAYGQRRSGIWPFVSPNPISVFLCFVTDVKVIK